MPIDQFFVADLTLDKTTHLIARNARQGLLLGTTADRDERSYEPFGSLPGGSLASGARLDAHPA